MINCNRINESVMAEMRRAGVGRKPVTESAMSDRDADRQEKAIKAKADKAKAKKDAIKPVKEDDEKEGLEDKQFDAPTGAAIDDLNKKDAGIDQGHDEAGEEEDDPTREKLETPQDEEDEQKGGAAELAADLRVSVRIERMNMGRYKKMLDKHDLSEEGQGWLKEKMADIQSTIDDMLERIPKLEKEAEEQEGGAEEAQTEIKEHMRVGIKKSIMEMATGKADESDDLKCVDNCGKKCDPTSSIKVKSFYNGKWNKGYRCKDCERDRKQEEARENAQAEQD